MMIQFNRMLTYKIHVNLRRRGGSSVGIATGYGLDGQGSNPDRGKFFLISTASRPTLGPTQPPIQRIPET
jgi:hypothetical protein